MSTVFCSEIGAVDFALCVYLYYKFIQVTANFTAKHSILGAISEAGVIDISLKNRKPAVVKKRNGNGKVVSVVKGRIGTRTEHYLAYLSNIMDVLDRNEMKGHYLVMDNAPIHTPSAVRDSIESRGYKCLYLPPYSPFLNPIEEFWSKVKAGIRRNALKTDDRLSDRICESVNKVTIANFWYCSYVALSLP